MIIFSPGAFGTTQPWSIWTKNAGGFLLGLLLAVKTSIRLFAGYRPPSWRNEDSEPLLTRRWFTPATLTRSLAMLTGAVLIYVFVSALDARATWQPSALSFEYHEFIRWLPHTLDSGST